MGGALTVRFWGGGGGLGEERCFKQFSTFTRFGERLETPFSGHLSLGHLSRFLKFPFIPPPKLVDAFGWIQINLGGEVYF